MLPPEILNQVHDIGWLLNWVPRIAGYAGRKYGEYKASKREELENRILDYLNTQVQSSGIDGMWADVILKPIIEDVPFSAAFPAQQKGLAKFKQNVKVLPYETRHRWRMMKSYVPEDKFKEILVKLVREDRIGYNTLSERYYCVLGRSPDKR